MNTRFSEVPILWLTLMLACVGTAPEEKTGEDDLAARLAALRQT